ncbi:hypothetical protein BN14_08213 [Rhizoctonia solani AG-1 IB]|uniref:Uncharacterized protein n=1 Tax=Thanatephorus cucumeris (strain AG1-IB / isolate 7/3/14) TaxID=1108050 RepID=M5C3Y9_THACB|nr:hypothetical protein BN14_08213 [Rhizoctonia solani AG-1 IB]
MTDNPKPKGKGLSTRVSNILRRNTRSTTDLSNVHEHDIASIYPSDRKITKKSKNNDSSDSISTFSSDDSDKKSRKSTIQPTSVPAGFTQEAMKDTTDGIVLSSNYTLSPTPPQVSRATSPTEPSNTAQPSVTMVVSSSQESEQIKDAGAAFRDSLEHTSSRATSPSTPKKAAAAIPETQRPGSTTPTAPRTEYIRRETPMHDLAWTPQDQYWLDRLKDGSYPGNEALDQVEKYLQITTTVVRNVINNRITSDQTPEEQDRTIKFMKSVAKINENIYEYAERSSLVYPQCIRNNTRMKIETETDLADHTNSTHSHGDEEEEEGADTVMDWDTLAASVDREATEPPIVDMATFTQTTNPSTPASPDILNLILAKLNILDNMNSRLDALEGKTPRVLPPSQTSAPPAPKPNPPAKPNNPQTTPNSKPKQSPAGVKWSEIASKTPSMIPEVNASKISNAIKRDISTQAQAQSDDKNYIVHFKTLPLVQPNPETIFVAMRDCLNARNRNLGAGKLTRVRWSLKASLHLSFSNNASIIEHAIPWLMEHLKLPEFTFGPEVPWSRLVVTNVPTGMGGSLQRMRNREEITQLLKEAFPESASFNTLKLTLAPDWIADPARLQAEGRTASSVAFSFEDAGGLASARLLNSPTIHIYNRRPAPSA